MGKQKTEREALEARVGELEAQVAAMREALEASDNFESLTRAVEHALANRDPDLAVAYRTEAEQAREEARRLRRGALATEAGRKMFERLTRLEQECKQWRTLLAATAKQSGGALRVSRAILQTLSPDFDIDLSSSDVMHTETVVQLIETEPGRQPPATGG